MQRLLEERIDVRVRDVTRLESVVGALDRECRALRAELTATAGRETELRTRLEDTRRSFAEKEAVFRESSVALKQEFELLAGRIFEEQGQSLTRRHQQQLDSVLTPFKDQIADFKQRVEHVYHTESNRVRVHARHGTGP